MSKRRETAADKAARAAIFAEIPAIERKPVPKAEFLRTAQKVTVAWPFPLPNTEEFERRMRPTREGIAK